ncbi:hypothetical protein [Leucobacter luti]|uniref:hypothetical protein n=1 Tax=Leucobacter luti TaxID=340320 RepID=UPI001C68C421|nr:hypothetical protein [Leucobacter luti]QYM75520.1 hypothetical protein K1X41_12950 [Leucobacter luti]
MLARLALNAVIWHVRAGDGGTGDDRAAYGELRSAGTEHTFHALLADGWAEEKPA